MKNWRNAVDLHNLIMAATFLISKTNFTTNLLLFYRSVTASCL